MAAMMNVNLAARSLLELCALAALCYSGFNTGGDAVSKLGLPIGAPLLAAVIWGTSIALRAPLDLPAVLRRVLELAIFGAATAALFVAGRPGLAATLAVAYAINRGLIPLGGIEDKAP